MPREPIPLIRKGGFADAEKLFILSFEGEVTERKYFQDFRTSEFFNNSGLIETIPLKRPTGRGSDPINVKKLLQEVKKEFRFKASDEFWLIIDRDHWEAIHHQNFNKLIEDCKAEKNFFTAISNPCFEIWLILHLKEIKDFTEAEQLDLFNNLKISNTKHYIDDVLGTLQGSGYNKRPNPNTYLPLTLIAIERAKNLDNLDEEYPLSIGTHVYKLVEKLLNTKSTNLHPTKPSGTPPSLL